MFILIPVAFFISLSYVLLIFPEYQNIGFVVGMLFSLLSGMTYGFDERLFGFRSILLLVIFIACLFLSNIIAKYISDLPSEYLLYEKISYFLGLFSIMGVLYLSTISIYTIYYYISNMSDIEDILDEANYAIERQEVLEEKYSEQEIEILKLRQAKQEVDVLNKKMIDEINKFEKEKQSLQNKIDIFKLEYKKLMKIQDDILIQKQKNDGCIKSLDKEIENYKKQNMVLKKQNEEYKSQKENLEKLIKRNLVLNPNQMMEYKTEIEHLENELRNFEVAIDGNDKEINILQGKIKREQLTRTQLEEQLKISKVEQGNQEKEIERLRKEIEGNRGKQRIGEFVFIWSKIEKMLKVNHQADEVEERSVNDCIKCFYEDGIIDRDLKNQLHEIYKKRCDVVHKGLSVSKRDIQTIKVIYELFQQACAKSLVK